MKRILLIATGGTIASKPTGEGLAPGIDSRELLECVPEAADIGATAPTRWPTRRRRCRT